MRYYHAGIDRASYVEMLAEEESAGLITAMWIMEEDLMEAYLNHPEVPLAIDSGAFIDALHVSEFTRTLCMLEREVYMRGGDGLKRFEWIASLDVIGDQEATDRNYERGSHSCGRLLWTYQVEGGKPPEHITSYAGKGDLIGVGGLVPLLRRDPELARYKIQAVGKTLARIGAQAHFFGVGSPRILTQFAEAEWFASADSTKWMNGLKERRMYLPDGGSVLARDLGLDLTGLECGRQNVRQMDEWAKGKVVQTLFS